jgi:hypothetical protein
MRHISNSFSHINLQRQQDKLTDKEWAMALPLVEVLKSEPKRVETYDDLVKNVAQILHRNRNYVLFYRGQSKDYKEDGKTIILPSIYRKNPEHKRLMLKERFETLQKKTEGLKKLFRDSTIKYAGTSMLNKYPEIAWSLLQHYEICDTPLLDLTHSLHVACSFAFDRNTNDTAIIYVLGLPWQTDAIGYNTFEELVNLRLLSVCPPQAQRPFFQEGYLTGPFPNYQLDNPKRLEQFDFARRLIAKFEIPMKNNNFWGVGFDRIPSEKLYQGNDEIKRICESLKNENEA